MSKETDFKWTDKDMIEFAKRCYTSTLENGHLVLESTLASFKAGSPSGRDFEILESSNSQIGVHKYIPTDSRFSCEREGCSIYSVRRNDKEVFKIKDSITLFGSATIHTIKSFKIQDGILWVIIEDDKKYILNALVKASPTSREKENNCNFCGGEMVLIRGKYPGNDKRYICPTCTHERLEQINEISSKNYGQAATQKINNPS